MMKIMIKINPTQFNYLYDNILIEPITLDTVDEETGLIRPQGYEDKPEIGRVIAIGEGRIFDTGQIIPLRIKVGDIVYFNKYSSVKVRLDTTDYLICREEDIQGYYRD